MKDILFDYTMNPTTWAYLASLITIAVYFKFRRFWSIRNTDILALIAFAPGVLLVSYSMKASSSVPEQTGYIWLFTVGGFFLVRLLLDPLMVRRPMLEPNLSASGLTFAGVALLVFLMSNVVTAKLSKGEVEGGTWMDKFLAREDSPEILNYLQEHGPGYPMFFIFSTFSREPLPSGTPEEQHKRGLLRAAATRTTAILAHLALVIGMVLVGYRHFDNIHTGVAAASLYLLMPYTAMPEYTPRVDHVIPAALMIWAVVAYRRPMVAGILLGLAAGVVYYPLYLLPLWGAFYWRRGLVRFGLGVGLVFVLLVLSLVLTSSSLASFWAQVRQMFGLFSYSQLMRVHSTGFWYYHAPEFRLPVLAAFVAFCCSLALWPAQKNLGTLLSCSAAVMLSTQFWKSQDGGVYMAWYLPLLILTVFRPNLEDRVALSAVSEGWPPWRRAG